MPLSLRRLAPFALAPLFTLISAAASGCGGDDDDEPPIRWGTCEAPFESMGECGTLSVPLDWDNPQGEKISVFVARTKASGTPRAQLWFLQGGPGASGAVFADRPAPEVPSVIDEYHQAFPEFDLYIIDHRGVGRSTRLGCPAFESDESAGGFLLTDAETPPCLEALKAEWGDRLRFFTSQAAARDLGAATDATRAPGQQLFVYSVSYGTYWAIQYLKARPADASGVVLDSIATPGVQFFNDFGLQADAVAEKLAALCAADALCAEKMGPDPWARVRAAVSKVRQEGQCFAAVKAEDERRILEADGDPATDGSFPDGATYAAIVEQFLRVTIQFRSLNTLLFPLLYRLERCEPADAVAFYTYLVELSTRLDPRADPAARLDSDMLRLHVGISEIYDPAAPPREAIEKACDEALFCSLPSDVVYRDAWPRYTPAPDVWQWPATDVPILAMNGELDSQTPIEKAEQIAGNLRAPTQNFVRVPFGTHTVLFNSPVQAAGGATCGGQMFDAFLRDPAAPPASGCLGDLARPAFTRSAEFAQSFFAQADVWENAAPPGEPAALASRGGGAVLRLPAGRRPERLGF
ncbi:MAG TPA: alpha/beta hydrolase [Polyangiaceae bacterium]|nr:alpha/beta hydrolase [Polyangiaceae bacterium]